MIRKHLWTLLFISSAVFAQDAAVEKTPTVSLNSELSYKMLEPNQDLRKVRVFLEQRQLGAAQDRGLIIGSSLIGIADYQKTTHNSKFGYLMRHPTSSNQIGMEVSEVVLHSFQVSFSGIVNSWMAFCAEILYDPEQSFGAGTITALSRNQLQLRKGFVVLGDLNKLPIYGALGKMDAPFGQTGSVNPFSNSTMWHAFGGLGYGAQIGFKKYGINAVFMAVQGGAQFRGMNAPVADSTAVPSMVNNFTADINYTIDITDHLNLNVGGSYLHGSAYCQEFPVTHFAAGRKNNPAVTYYGKLKINDRLTVMGSFAQTLEVWPGTYNPNPPLDIYEASKVTSMDVGAKFDFNLDKKIVYSVSGEFSNFTAGPDGAPWERQNQIILGFAGMIKNSSKLFVELVRADGYVPLNFITGSEPNQPFPVGTTHSLNKTNTMGVVIGAMLTL